MNGIDWNSRLLELKIDGRTIHVPFMQAVLLSELLARSDRYSTTGHLGECLYGLAPDGKTPERIRVGALMRQLRRTLRGSGLEIHNKYGAGYRSIMEGA